MGSETFLEDRGGLLPVVLFDPLLGLLGIALLTEHKGEQVRVEGVDLVLTEVEHGVDGVGGLRLVRVVTETDAKGANDTIGSADGHAVLLPDGHSAEREPWGVLHGGEGIELDALVLVLVASVGEHHANGRTTAVHVEVD